MNPPRPQLIRVTTDTELPAALGDHGVDIGCPVLVIVGGAAGMSEELSTVLRVTFGDVMASVLDDWGVTVIDGGTDSGVMRLIGQARHSSGARFPLIGVAALGTVELDQPRTHDDAAPLEQQHTHVVLVPGNDWGDETPWLSSVADIVAAGHPSATVLVNGGQIALADAEASLASGRALIVLAGTGRVADEIADAASSGVSGRAAAVAKSALTSIVDNRDPQAVIGAIAAALTDLPYQDPSKENRR